MKRQRRTLALLLAGFAATLWAIGMQGKARPSPEAVAPAAFARLRGARGDGLNPQPEAPIVGSLAWLGADPRHGSGADLVLRLNAENDGLGRDASDSSARSPSAASGGQGARAAARDAVRRLGWSGCTAYSHGCDPWGGPPSHSDRFAAKPGFQPGFEL
jgi:hypothetical protein